MDLAKYFTQELDDDTKIIMMKVFGAHECVDPETIKPYFKYYRQELKSSIILNPPPIKSHQHAIQVFELLKANVAKSKTTINIPEGDSIALDLGVRAMLATACKSPGTFGGDIFNPMWKSDETLEQYIRRVYPRWAAPTDERRNVAISVVKLTAYYLTHDARIRIEWTDRLTDHLELLVGADWKTIYIFRCPCYLKMCLKALSTRRRELDQTVGESLALGCLPPDLLIETLSTYNLLFPRSDQYSQEILRNAAKNDPSFAEPFSIYSSCHDDPRDARSPENVKSLYEKFPYWGERLDVLWKEIENPAPVTRLQKWSDKRTSALWMTWWGVLGIGIAVLFGVAATVLGALQVWISYCSWMDDSTVFGCSAKKQASTTLPATSML